MAGPAMPASVHGPAAPVRCLRRILAVVVLVLVAIPASAQAHAFVENTTPGPGVGLGTPPSTVTIRFNEAVEAPAGAVKVIDARGRTVQLGDTFHPAGDGSTVAVRLARLPRGTY